MKIQHWAIIFIILVLPMSIITRSKISKKMAVLKDETRINNIVDNATYDAVSQIIELAEVLEFGKDIPLTTEVAESAVDRFFTTLAVNFNINPIRKTTGDGKWTFESSAQQYFSQYIPAVVIVGYDCYWIYSYDSGKGAYTMDRMPYPKNYTLDNKYTISSNTDEVFMDLGDGGKKTLTGYVGVPLDLNGNGIDDWTEPDMVDQNPYSIPEGVTTEAQDYINTFLPMYTDNLSYIIYEAYMHGCRWADNYKALAFPPEQYSDIDPNKRKIPGVGSTDAEKPDFSFINQDYVFDINGNLINRDNVTDDDKLIVKKVSSFHTDRRKEIIEELQRALNTAFNNQNQYADLAGFTYRFNLPQIGNDKWINTIDDISVLAFIQGIPIGNDELYNNYALGGSRIVRGHNYLAEVVEDSTNGLAGEHPVYHRWFCRCVPRNKEDGTIKYREEGSTTKFGADDLSTKGGYPDTRTTYGIEREFITTDDARRAGYYACSECM